jgi:DNA-binding transcriptional LysR family regulator
MLLRQVVPTARIRELLRHAGMVLQDSEALLCWRGKIPEYAFETIDAVDGSVLASGFPRAASSHELPPLPRRYAKGHRAGGYGVTLMF